MFGNQLLWLQLQLGLILIEISTLNGRWIREGIKAERGLLSESVTHTRTLVGPNWILTLLHVDVVAFSSADHHI